MESFIICANSAQCLHQLELREDIAVAVSRQHARATASARDIFCFDKSNNIQNYSVALLIRNGRLQMQEWNKKIQQIIESGIIGKWMTELENETKIGSDADIRLMGIQDLYGGLMLCFCLLIVATSVFILELIVHYKLKDANSHRYWKSFDWMIDGQSHLLKLRAKHAENREDLLQPPIPIYQSRIRHFNSRQSLTISQRRNSTN